MQDTQHQSEDTVRVLGALSDANRFRIVALLASAGELSCRAIASRLGLSASLASHHLSILERVNLIERRKNGFWTLNRLCREELSRHIGALQTLIRPASPPTN